MFFFILAYENIVEQKRMEIKFQRRMKATQVAYSKSIRTLLFFLFSFLDRITFYKLDQTNGQ